MNNLNDQMELMAETCEQGLNLVASSVRSPTTDENCTPRDACVMIIDDENINIEIVKAYLEEEGFENLVATTQASKAMDMLREAQTGHRSARHQDARNIGTRVAPHDATRP